MEKPHTGLDECPRILQGSAPGCHSGNGEKLSSTQAESGQAIKSAVAYFPSISGATSWRRSRYSRALEQGTLNAGHPRKLPTSDTLVGRSADASTRLASSSQDSVGCWLYGGCTAGHPNLRRPIRKFNEFRFANFSVDIFAACSCHAQTSFLVRSRSAGRTVVGRLA